VGANGAVYAQENGNLETVVVTGYRASLEKAMDIKRTAVDASDSILAEDIGKFPDMNVSESLQRIPGVAISRESGEGRQVTVRGLGAQFTRVRINGMESLSTVGGEDTNTSSGGGGTNRSRAFDFNVFASDLFSALTIHKSNSASIEEGSLGATVDLKTGHPFDHQGFVFNASGQWGYQQYGGGSSPRVAALVSDTFLGGRLGFLVSGAYGVSNTLEEGTDNGRWVSDQNNTAGTHTSPYQFWSVNGATSGTDFNTANTAFRGRFPRYAIIPLHSKRLGLTGSVQWQPDDKTLFTVDALFADFAQVRQEMYMEPYALSTTSTSIGNTGTATQYPRVSSGSGSSALCIYASEVCSAYTLTAVQLATHNAQLINYDSSDIDANNTLTRAEMKGVGLRSEHRLDHLDTRFMQVTIDGSREFSETFKVHGMAGWSESHHRNPIQTTLTADLGCITNSATACTATQDNAAGAGSTSNPFTYDYASGKIPLVNMGLTDATNPAGWYLSQIRERAMYNYNSYRTAVLDVEYKPTKEVTLSGGLNYRNYGYGTYDLRRSRGTNTNMDAIIPYPVQAAFVANPSSYTQTVQLKALSTPNGSTTSWFVPDLNKFNDAFGIWDTSASRYPFTNAYAQGACKNSSIGNTNAASNCGAFNMGIEPAITSDGNVREDDYGGWVQAAWDTDLYGMSFRGDVGARYILTEQSTNGYALDASGNILSVHEHQVYHDVLPALNAVLEPAEDFLVRFNASYAMTRPSLSSLLPSSSASVSGSNWTYSAGNPKLPPNRSKNLDLAFEWYYSKGALISVAGFWKHLDNITKSYSTPINWATGAGITAPGTYGLSDESPFAGACGLSLAQWTGGGTSSTCGNGRATTWQLSTNINDKGAPLYGTEINWQQPLDFLPGHFSYLGVMGNMTYVQAQQTYIASAGVNYTGDLIGLSRNQFNGTIYYDDEIFQARVTAAYRGKFMIASAMNTLNLGTFSASTLNVDASASYKFDENIMLTLDALNLTNQAMDIYVDSTAQRTNIYHKTGAVLFAGVRFTY
jgi:TonB-dependent receptor